MKAAKDRREEYYDPAKITFWEGKRHDWSWEEHIKDPVIALDKALKCLENPYCGLTSGSKRLVESRVNCHGLQLCGHQDVAQDVRKAVLGKASGLAWTRGTVCACGQRPVGTLQGSMGRMASSFSSLSRRSRWLRTRCRPIPMSLRETLKACALIGRHLSAARGEAGSSGVSLLTKETCGGTVVV